MKFTRPIFSVLFLIVLSFVISIPAPAGGAEDRSDLSLDDIAKTEAARSFIAKDYSLALHGFQKLEQEHPHNLIIKRYMASVYDGLREREKAIAKLKEVIRLNPDDFIARQMLGEIYIKKGELEKAKEQFQYNLDKNPLGDLANFAKTRLNTIEKSLGSETTMQGQQMSVSDFMKSESAQIFAKGNYEEALRGFERLSEQYPKDVLIARFRGIALLRLGRKQEAVEALRHALEIDPKNTAAHYYLGQTLNAADKPEQARKEFRWVIEHDEATYKLRAQQAMFQTLGKGNKPLKPWTFTASQDYNYETNATYKSSDPNDTTPGDQNSGKYSTLLYGTDRFYQKGRWMFTGDALYAQTLYDDFESFNSYTPGAGISALYGFAFLGRPAFLNVRDGQAVTFLKNKFYVWTNTLSPSLIWILHDRFRSALSYRWGFDDYENKGSSPNLTSRNGFSHVVSILNTHYLNEDKTFYWTHGYDYERHNTAGLNYISNVNIGRLGIHAPLIKKLEGDLSFVFKDSDYYRYAYSPPPRRDDVYTLTVSLSQALTALLNLSASYIYENSRARNNAYEYVRHVFGVKLTLRL